MEWTEERVGELSALWNTGLTATEIANRLGGVTRNAVIGKIHRLGLSPRPSPIKRERERPAVVPIAERPCQWPFGDPGEAEFHFCGGEALAGKPYCVEHEARAYRTIEESPETGNADKAA